MTQQNCERQVNFPGLDCVKFFASMLVLMSHMGPFISYGDKINFYLVNLSFRFAVPFFFLCAGFFFFRSERVSWKYLGKYIWRIFVLYAVWTVPYILIQLPYTISLDTIKVFLLQGSYGHLWYLPSLIISVVFVFVLLKVQERLFFLGAFAGCVVASLYFLGLCGDAYGGISQIVTPLQSLLNPYIYVFGNTRNGILFGGLFVWLGGTLARWDGWRQLKTKVLGVALGFCVALLSAEIVIVRQLGWNRDLNILISIIPLTLVVFTLAAQDEPCGNMPWANWMRKMSTLIYCSHMLVKVLMWQILSVVNPNVHSMTFFLVVLVSTILLSAAIEKLSRKYYFLKVLY